MKFTSSEKKKNVFNCKSGELYIRQLEEKLARNADLFQDRVANLDRLECVVGRVQDGGYTAVIGRTGMAGCTSHVWVQAVPASLNEKIRLVMMWTHRDR
jgi:hypothetical protein